MRLATYDSFEKFDEKDLKGLKKKVNKFRN